MSNFAMNDYSLEATFDRAVDRHCNANLGTQWYDLTESQRNWIKREMKALIIDGICNNIPKRAFTNLVKRCGEISVGVQNP